MSHSNLELRGHQIYKEENQSNLLDYLNGKTKVQLESRIVRTGRIANVVSGLSFRNFNEYPSQKFVENVMAIQKVNDNPLSEPYDLDAAPWGARVAVKFDGKPIFITHKVMYEKTGYSIVRRNGHNTVVCCEFSPLKPCENTLVDFVKVLGNKVARNDMKTVMDKEVSRYIGLKQDYPELVDDKLTEELLDENPAYHISSIMKSDVLLLLIDKILEGRFSSQRVDEPINNTIESTKINLDEKLRVVAQGALSGITKIIVYKAVWEGQRDFIRLLGEKLPTLRFQPPTKEFQEQIEALLLVLGIRRLDISYVRSRIYPRRRDPDYYKARRNGLWHSVNGSVRKYFQSLYGELS